MAFYSRTFLCWEDDAKLTLFYLLKLHRPLQSESTHRIIVWSHARDRHRISRGERGGGVFCRCEVTTQVKILNGRNQKKRRKISGYRPKRMDDWIVSPHSDLMQLNRVFRLKMVYILFLCNPGVQEQKPL